MAPNIRTQKFCLWSGPLALAIFGLGFALIGRLLPPPAPSASAADVVRFYRSNLDGVRAGLGLMMIAGAVTAPFVGAVTVQMRRIEGEFSPLAYTQMGTGMLGVLLFVLPAMFLEAAVFRPQRDPQIVLAMHDLAWILLIGTFSCLLVQCLSIAACIFTATDERVYPRWLAFFNVWVALTFLPGLLLYFFKSGPFAWNGLFVFWIPLSVFFGWFVVMFVMTIKAVDRHANDQAS